MQRTKLTGHLERNTAMVTAEETAKPQATARQTGPQEPPIEVQIAALAHSLWEERGCPLEARKKIGTVPKKFSGLASR